MQRDVLSGLRRRYEVDFQLDLTPRILEVVNLNEYLAMISHVPACEEDRRNAVEDALRNDLASFYAKTYRKSLAVIKRIKRAYPNLPMIGYTGADNMPVVDELFLANGLSALIRKNRAEEDITKLMEAIAKC